MKAKVFCIGFHKTGTTSIKLALRALGYRVTGPNGVDDRNIAENVYEMVYKLAERYDAFQDNPWPIVYREMDVRYPGSKFILLLRDPDTWIGSQVQHFGQIKTPMREWIYGVGCPIGNESIYIRRFVQHNQEVTRYFADRPDDLLVMDLAKGDGWEQLCPFLGVNIPDVPFPHANKGADRESKRKTETGKTLRYQFLVKKTRKALNRVRRLVFRNRTA